MSPIYRSLLIALVAAGLVAGIYRWGASEANEAHQIAQAKKDKDDANAFQKEVERGDDAVQMLQTQRAVLADQYQQLDGAFNAYKKRYSLTNRAAAAAGAAAGQPQAGGAAAPFSCPLAAADAEPVLTHGAVWLWNSALAGQDQPSGACGLADPTAPACALESGLTLTDAWANQALNARQCAEDRLAHSRLIDYLLQQQPKELP